MRPKLPPGKGRGRGIWPRNKNSGQFVFLPLGLLYLVATSINLLATYLSLLVSKRRPHFFLLISSPTWHGHVLNPHPCNLKSAARYTSLNNVWKVLVKIAGLFQSLLSKPVYLTTCITQCSVVSLELYQSNLWCVYDALNVTSTLAIRLGYWCISSPPVNSVHWWYFQVKWSVYNNYHDSYWNTFK